MRKLVVEGGWVLKRLYDIGWSDEKKDRGCKKEKGTEKHRLYHCPSCREVRNLILDGLGKWNKGKHVEGVLRRILWADAIGGKAICQSKSWESRTRTRTCQSEAYRTMSPPIALGWESQAAGVHVGGQLCKEIMTRRWSQCMGCTERWMLNLRYDTPSRGQPHHGSCEQQRYH